MNDISKTVQPHQKSLRISYLGIALACLFFLVPLCSLPPFRIGYYSQIEAGIFAFWSLSALSSLWIYFLQKRNPQLVLHCSKLPIVWGPICMGFLTMILSLFHPLPLRDFIGSGQIGEGAITFIAGGIMACHFSIFTRISLYRKLIFACALCTGLLICILTIIGSMDSPFLSWRYWKWAAFFFPDFLAFIDIALISIYLYMRKEIKRYTFIYDIIALILFCVIAYYTSNKSLTYALGIAGLTILGIGLFPRAWRKRLLQLSFFGISFLMTMLIIFYDDFSRLLPQSLISLGHLSTITSRTWLSKVAFVDLWLTPFNELWLEQFTVGSGWGTFGNISAANMFLIDQISLFSGKEYQPNWELVNRDLMHTHNVITNIFHSIGVVGLCFYVFTQYKLIDSLTRTQFWLGAAFLIIYQVQLLFWFQLIMTIPYTILVFALLFREQLNVIWAKVLKPKLMMMYAMLILICAGFQGYLMIGYKQNFPLHAGHSLVHFIDVLTTSPYTYAETLIGAQRQVILARTFSMALQDEFKKSPQKLATYSLKIVNYFNTLPKGSNFLANNVALNILSELAANPDTLKYLDKSTYKTWESLVKDHIKYMPYRSDILLPFFNLYQTLGQERIVLDFSSDILEKNPQDPIALWFTGSSQLKNPEHFNEGMCMLQKSMHHGIERFMPIPPVLKTKIITYAYVCP